MSQVPEVLYPAGTTISSSKPLVYVLDDDCKAKYCDECFKPRTSLKKCSRCRCMFYCDEVCQKLNWKRNHKRECSPDLARLDQSKRFGLTALPLFYDPEVVKQIFFLNPLDREDKDRENGSKVKSFTLQDLPSFPEIAGGDILPPFLRILQQKIYPNKQMISNVDGTYIGAGLYVAESCITSHSCAPNAVFVFKGVQAYLRSMVDIHVGQPITVCNGMFFSPRIERKRTLFLRFGIDCTCEMCEEEWDKDIDYRAFNSQIGFFNASCQTFPEILAASKSVLQERILPMKQCYLTMLRICKYNHPRLSMLLMNIHVFTRVAQEKWPNLNIANEEFDDMFPDLLESVIESFKITHDPRHQIWDIVNILIIGSSVQNLFSFFLCSFL